MDPEPQPPNLLELQLDILLKIDSFLSDCIILLCITEPSYRTVSPTAFGQCHIAGLIRGNFLSPTRQTSLSFNHIELISDASVKHALSILCLIPRTTVTSLSTISDTRCKTHPLCVNPGIHSFLNSSENTQVWRAITNVFLRNTRWRYSRSWVETKYVRER